MGVLKLTQLFCFFLLQRSTLGATVAEDISVYQLERLVAMLNKKECVELLRLLSDGEEDIFKHLDRLSPENNKLGLKPRLKRETSSASDNEAQCHTALKDWLLTSSETIYFDRISRSLRHMGRTDIALELRKNINQDKTVNLKRYVEDYHKYVSSLNVLQAPEQQQVQQKVIKRKVADLTWRNLDLIVERGPVPLYQKGPMDAAVPLLYGLLLGFGGALLAVPSLVFLAVHICRRRPQDCPPRATTSWSQKPRDLIKKL